ncbi:hypothetical protein HU200_052253 [Digitaria exilis]|uniref:At1g61320/AtMIF1 LRR domain-containing protein n=1 Tax=Digitaria exilis TaxID=1010633 RepID=A0A835E7F6_9POAL|nr:hypothetical protein HU200_052253 [Digitaria exilis]
MRNHSGIGVKTLELRPISISSHNLNSWLQVAVKPGIEKLTLRVCHFKKYKFPLSLLSDGVRSYLRIFGCGRLKLIESKAPNLSTLDFWGKPKLVFGEALQMKTLSMFDSDVVCYARTELPSIMPNLDILHLCSTYEVVDTPMLPTRFLYLKHLTINLISGPWPYDYFSLVSFLDVSPSLETLSLDVSKKPMEDEFVFGHSPHLRHMAEDQHCHLKNVKITGFSSAKSLMELTCYILKNAVSLECLTLDTSYGCASRCSDSEFGRCGSFGNGLREACRSLWAIKNIH